MTAFGLVLLSVAILLIPLPYSFVCKFGNSSYANVASGIVMCFVSIANALLLYSTLQFQSSSFRHERFEATFFNLLERQEMLTRNLIVVDDVWHSLEEEIKNTQFKSQQCFKYVYTEIALMKDSIKNVKEMCYFDNHEYEQGLMYYEREKEKCNGDLGKIANVNVKLQDYMYLKRLQYMKTKYDIMKVEYRSEEELNIICYDTIMKIRKDDFEHYYRNFKQLFVHINNNKKGKNERLKYANYIASQMSWYEMKLLSFHVLGDNHYRKDFYHEYKGCYMDEILKRYSII